jgi:hypothetical protein
VLALSGCGYHTLGAATHLPPDIKTLAVPVFATRTEASGTEQALTEAVIREFATRTRFRVTPDSGEDADAVLHGTILKQTTTPLTYNSATQQSSSFVITIVASLSRSLPTTAEFSTRTRTTSSASSTNPQPTCPRSSRKIRPPFSACRANLRGSWWPTSLKAFERVPGTRLSLDSCPISALVTYLRRAVFWSRMKDAALERAEVG